MSDDLFKDTAKPFTEKFEYFQLKLADYVIRRKLKKNSINKTDFCYAPLYQEEFSKLVKAWYFEKICRFELTFAAEILSFAWHNEDGGLNEFDNAMYLAARIAALRLYAPQKRASDYLEDPALWATVKAVGKLFSKGEDFHEARLCANKYFIERLEDQLSGMNKLEPLPGEYPCLRHYLCENNLAQMLQAALASDAEFHARQTTEYMKDVSITQVTRDIPHQMQATTTTIVKGGKSVVQSYLEHKRGREQGSN